MRSLGEGRRRCWWWAICGCGRVARRGGGGWCFLI
uniref:Uncharacterized protein n=1 Tax=Arundo donax TaxID=35708 RepID=A0A0A9H799_ARUDO